MLNELSQQTRNEIRLLNKILSAEEGTFASPEERDGVMEKLVHHISDVVISILLREDREGLTYFLNNK